MTEIEKNYCKARKNTPLEHIDFWGINFADSSENAMTFKTYQSGKISRNDRHPWIEYLKEKSMIRHFEDVIGGEEESQVRLDISLYQRNDSNMSALFEFLKQRADFLKAHLHHVEKLSRMKITDVESYNYAALYHVGMAEDNGILRMVKFHFFTRWCEDPNRFYKDGYRDEEYLAYVRSMGISQYQKLAENAEYILEKCGGHLWMIGMDVAPEKQKYKIYLKNVTGLYQYLMNLLEEEGKRHLRKIAKWNEGHRECRIAGVALAMDSQNRMSFNLYYHVD